MNSSCCRCRVSRVRGSVVVFGMLLGLSFGAQLHGQRAWARRLAPLPIPTRGGQLHGGRRERAALPRPSGLPPSSIYYYRSIYEIYLPTAQALG